MAESQSEKKYIIRPGLSVEVAVRIDYDKSEIDVRRSFVYDSVDDQIILAQTTPSLVSSQQGGRVAVTYVKKDTSQRVGISGKFARLKKDYQLSTSQTVPVLIINTLSNLKKYNLRMAFRIRPVDENVINIYSNDRECLDIFDISHLGVKFGHSKHREYTLDEQVRLSLRFNKQDHPVMSRIVRKEPVSGTGLKPLKNLECVSVRFLDLDPQAEDQLVRIVRDVERQMHYNQMFS